LTLELSRPIYPKWFSQQTPLRVVAAEGRSAEIWPSTHRIFRK
jgi:hypothetical protein